MKTFTDCGFVSIADFLEKAQLAGGVGNVEFWIHWRDEIIKYALSFEECDCTREELELLPDKDLCRSAYYIMADYATGQI